MVVLVAQGNWGVFFAQENEKTKKIVPRHPQHPCRQRAHSREAERQTVVLVKTACEMEAGRLHTSRNQTTKGGGGPTNTATTNQPNNPTNEQTTNTHHSMALTKLDEPNYV